MSLSFKSPWFALYVYDIVYITCFVKPDTNVSPAYMGHQLEARFMLTLLNGSERKGVLANKVILGGLVIILDYEAHQGELGCVDGELQSVVPHRVEACPGDSSQWLGSESQQPTCICMICVVEEGYG